MNYVASSRKVRVSSCRACTKKPCMCDSIVSMTSVAASPKMTFNSSKAPDINARNTCHNWEAKPIWTAFPEILLRMSAIPLAWCVALAIASRQNRIAARWFEAM